MRNKGLLFTVFVALFLLQSCGINSNLMFRTPKGVKEISDSIPMKPASEYKISKDDKFTFMLYTNEGERIVNEMAGMSKEAVEKAEIEYVVRTDGTADLPILGAIRISGLSVKECEDTLAKLFEQKNGYNKPFVQVKLTNQRVIVFPGNGSAAKVIPLQNNNTTLMEAIALAGGIAERGKASKVKIMRIEKGVRTMYVVDLSKIEGLQYVDMIVQANDYIYIEPKEQVGQEALKMVVPVVAVISSTLVIITVFSTLK
ncbi:polysaccharide biosynthesis/export family protein [Fluviicola sp.]|jgi:polysaccharide export outer membrane protein|uniref:polysaccharide biosynthesis/export family protein n=1 Tax=Fluviicola sp. TaxID=1917219 RepID=UPI002820528E|nr:polysaccharide biosynthesis/export family protein [Fluviicola sp.]MDR0803217.1 polysaccharide biosynthesis/export family protein [Fluviicola sp.]